MRNSFKECFRKTSKHVHPVRIGMSIIRPTCKVCKEVRKEEVYLDFDFNFNEGVSYTIFCPKCGWINGKEENVMSQSQKQWWIRAYQKLLENMLSVKVWILGGNAVISAWLVWRFQTPETIGSLFSDWCAFNGGVVTAIIGMREAFKVALVKVNGNGEEREKKKMSV
jgi:hypothetical protein